jgi:hypothetical protein
MKWFKRMIIRWVRDDWESVGHEDQLIDRSLGMGTQPSKHHQMVASRDVDSDESLNITIRNAGGGKIVTFRKYDQKTDRSSHKLYVIPDDHDFEKELGQLITMESLR